MEDRRSRLNEHAIGIGCCCGIFLEPVVFFDSMPLSLSEEFFQQVTLSYRKLLVCDHNPTDCGTEHAIMRNDTIPSFRNSFSALSLTLEKVLLGKHTTGDYFPKLLLTRI